MLLLALSLAAAAIALLVSKAELTEWIRKAAPKRIQHGLRCPFCVSFWASAALVAFHGAPPGLSLSLAVLATWGGAAAIVGLAVRGVADEAD